jgi:hypothetical protein
MQFIKQLCSSSQLKSLRTSTLAEFSTPEVAVPMLCICVAFKITMEIASQNWSKSNHETFGNLARAIELSITIFRYKGKPKE